MGGRNRLRADSRRGEEIPVSFLIDGETRVLIQGITGREASEKLPEMLDYGTRVVAGVTPGKGGQREQGIPVYDSVEEALEEHEVDASLIYVPPFAVKEAAFEAMESGIPLLNIITERTPIKDAWKIREKASETDTTVIGPTSVGIIKPGESKMGPIGGSEPEKVYRPGKVGIISKSGGMTTETAWVVNQAGYGISTAFSIGGDRIPCTSLAEGLEMFENDPETEAVVMFGELGGLQEIEAAEKIRKMDKPVISFVAGEFTEELGEKQFGHAGAIIRSEREKPSFKKEKLEDAGSIVVDMHHRIGEELDRIL